MSKVQSLVFIGDLEVGLSADFGSQWFCNGQVLGHCKEFVTGVFTVGESLACGIEDSLAHLFTSLAEPTPDLTRTLATIDRELHYQGEHFVAIDILELDLKGTADFIELGGGRMGILLQDWKTDTVKIASLQEIMQYAQ